MYIDVQYQKQHPFESKTWGGIIVYCLEQKNYHVREITLLEFSGGRMLNLLENFKSNKSGILCVLGAFLIQVCAGSYHGTFGNLLPYFTSYLKQVRVY